MSVESMYRDHEHRIQEARRSPSGLWKLIQSAVQELRKTISVAEALGIAVRRPKMVIEQYVTKTGAFAPEYEYDLPHLRGLVDFIEQLCCELKTETENVTRVRRRLEELRRAEADNKKSSVSHFFR